MVESPVLPRFMGGSVRRDAMFSMARCVVALTLALALPALLAACATEAPTLEVRDVPVTATARKAAPAWRKAGVLGPGDQLDIFVWGYPDYTRRATVSSAGALPHPMLGDLQVAGKTVEQTQALVRAALTDYIKDPVVRVTLAGNRSQRIHVLGEVVKPGVYPMAEGDTSLIEVLAQAGGLTPDARGSNIVVVRELDKQVEIRTVDFRRITREGDLLSNLALQEGDIIYVPTSFMADATREASRLSQIVSTLLVIENATVLFQPFTRALLHGTTTSSGNPIVVPN